MAYLDTGQIESTRFDEQLREIKHLDIIPSFMPSQLKKMPTRVANNWLALIWQNDVLVICSLPFFFSVSVWSKVKWSLTSVVV